MATVERTVELIFAGIDQTTGVLRGISGGLSGLGDVAETVARPFAQVADAVLKADAALVALAAAGLTLAVNEAGKFGDAFAEISTLTSATGKDLDAFKGQILDYSRTSVKSFEEINDAVYQAISLGIDYQDALSAVGTAEKLAVAGKADLGRTIELLVGTMNAYGAGVEEAERYSDSFFTTVRLGKTTIPELASAMANVTATAAAAGIPIETVNAALAALTAAGMPTSLAVTSLNAAINGIIKPTGEARKAAEAMGIELSAGAITAKGFEGVMADVGRVTGGNAGELVKLFTAQEAFKGVTVLATDASGKFAGALEAQKVKAGETAAAYAKMADNFALVNQNVVNNLRATLIQVGEPLLEQYGDTARAVSAVLAAVGTSLKAGDFDPLLAALNKAGKGLEDFLLGVAKAFPDAMKLVDFSELVKALEGMGGTLAGFFKGIDLTTPEGLAKALQGAVDSLTGLVKITEGIAIAFEPVVAAIRGGAEAFNKLTDTELRRLGEDILGTAKLVNEFGAGFTAVFKLMGDDASTWADRIGVAFHAAGAGAEAFFAIWNTVTGVVATILEKLITAIDTVTFGMVPGLDTAADGLREIAKAEFKDLETAFGGVVGHLNALGVGAGEADAQVAALDGHVGGMALALGPAGVAARGLALDLKPLRDEAGNSATEMKAAAGGFQAVATEAGNTATELKAAAGGFKTGAAEIAGVGTAAAAAGKKLYGFSQDADGTWRNVEAVGTAADGADKSLYGFSQTADGTWTNVAKVGDEAATAGGKLQAAGQDTEDFRLKMATLQSQFAGTALKLNVDLQVAKLEAETKQIAATFESLNVAIGSTGDVIVGLFGQLSGAMGSGNVALQNKLNDALAREESRRRDAFDLQKSLTEEQIKALKLRNAALAAGGALIQIDSTGLEPALETVMWHILEKVQLRVNASAADFLLGVT